MEHKPKVLFLCTENSCRSQMAEGFLRKYAGDRFDVYSAGTFPAERIHPQAIQVMAEKGIDISKQEPKNVRNYLGRLLVAHLIVVCDVANEQCPRVFPGVVERQFWPVEDPTSFSGSPDETVAAFRSVRDKIDAMIKQWLADS